ncbi:hypothetical protein [Stenotrophomonas bentonitica]
MKKISVSFAVPVLLALAGCGQSPSERTAESSEPAPAAATAQPEAAAPAATAPPAADGVAAKYEGKVVRRPHSDSSKQDGWFYVTEGKRFWIGDSGWLKSKGMTPADIVEITAEELQAIPEDAEVLRSPQQPAAGG